MVPSSIESQNSFHPCEQTRQFLDTGNLDLLLLPLLLLAHDGGQVLDAAALLLGVAGEEVGGLLPRGVKEVVHGGAPLPPGLGCPGALAGRVGPLTVTALKQPAGVTQQPTSIRQVCFAGFVQTLPNDAFLIFSDF